MHLVFIDLSSIAYPIWHMNSADPDPEVVSRKIVAAVLRFGTNEPHVAVCCDSGRTFRHDLDPTYKANRPEREAALMHQIGVAVDHLKADGFPVWSVKGFEADDLIASGVWRMAPDDLVSVVSADKDLSQLVGNGVAQVSPKDGTRYDADAIVAKFGVRPDQMRDWLTLVGDSSDNIKGASGIGPKKATDLLTKFPSLDALYRTLAAGEETGLTPGVKASLLELEPRLATVRELLTLRTDVVIPFAEIVKPREANTPPMDTGAVMADESAIPSVESDQNGGVPGNQEASDIQQRQSNVQSNPLKSEDRQMTVAVTPAPDQWERQLEPRDMREAITVSKFLHESRLFLGSYGNPQAVLSTILAGRELGLQAMAALRGMHIIDGKPTLSADLIRALVLRSGLAKFFRCTERSATRATFETQRGDDPPFALTFTIEEGHAAFAKDEKAWSASGWGKNPADMLVARASAKLARLVYPDVTFSLYAPEEFDNV